MFKNLVIAAHTNTKIINVAISIISFDAYANNCHSNPSVMFNDQEGNYITICSSTTPFLQTINHLKNKNM